jgi:hypothetical protein
VELAETRRSKRAESERLAADGEDRGRERWAGLHAALGCSETDFRLEHSSLARIVCL